MSKLAYRTCRQLNADGILCGSPALKGERYCYYHQRDRQRRKVLDSPRMRRIHRLTPDVLKALDLPPMDDQASIRVCINTLMRGILAGLVDKQQAGQVLYLIQLATINNAIDSTPTSNHLVAITDPEPIEVPISEHPADEMPQEPEPEPKPLEAVMVQLRQDISGKLAPRLFYEQAQLEAIDKEWFTRPACEPEEEEEPDAKREHA
jgi:hypothetical protein